MGILGEDYWLVHVGPGEKKRRGGFFCLTNGRVNVDRGYQNWE